MRALGLAALLLAACADDGPSTEAIRIESLDQAIGGPAAAARVGDFKLSNERISVVIDGGRSSFRPLNVGGTIIDADLTRPEASYRGGRGFDALGQLAAVANLYIAKATVEAQVRITRSASGAEVTTAAKAGPI